MKRLALWFLVVISCACYAAAQRDGTIPVPVKWLMDNTDKMIGVFPQTSDKKSQLKSDTVLEAGSYRPCGLEWKSNKPKRGIYIFVPLRDMNPQRVAVLESDKVANPGTGFWQLTLFATDRKKSIVWTGDKAFAYSNEIRLVLPDKNTAERFARALRDAVTQCGGKPDTPEPY